MTRDYAGDGALAGLCSGAALGLLLMVGCSEEVAGRPAYFSGVDNGDQQLASLQDEELLQICESFDVYVDTYVDLSAVAYISCLPHALVLGGSEAGCRQLLDSCMSIFPAPIRVMGEVRTQEACFQDLRSCQATVTQLETCANVNVDQILQIEGWSCDLIGDDEVINTARSYDSTVSVCTDLNDACNDFAAVRRPE